MICFILELPKDILLGQVNTKGEPLSKGIGLSCLALADTLSQSSQLKRSFIYLKQDNFSSNISAHITTKENFSRNTVNIRNPKMDLNSITPLHYPHLDT